MCEVINQTPNILMNLANIKKKIIKVRECKKKNQTIETHKEFLKRLIRCLFLSPSPENPSVGQVFKPFKSVFRKNILSY